MLTRPGSAPGSGWMRDVSERLACGPADTRPVPRRFWLLWIAYMAIVFVTLQVVQRRAMPSYDIRSYESSTHIAGVPLYASGPAPIAIVAIGGHPRGVIALGGIAFGVIAVGGVAIGWRALGGGAIGYRAFGGLAIGGYTYAGNGIAFGYHEAGGRQKEKLFG